MPTHDYVIDNGTGAAVREDINLALQAIVSLNSSASEPATMYAYQLWADTGNNLLKIRNSANSAWVTLRQLDGDFSIVAVEDGLQATPSLTFTNDLNTGIFRPGNDSLAIVTNALRAITITSTQAVGIQTANPSSALHVAGNARVGADDTTDAHLQIGKGATGNRNSYIDIVGDTTYTDYGVRFIRNNTGANATSEIKHRGTGAFNIVTQEAAPIEFYTTNSPRLTILAGGEVGIGSSSPPAALTVVGSAGSGDAGINISSGSTTLGSKAALFFIPSSSPSVITGSAIKSERLSPDGSDLQFFTVSALGNAPVRAMTIDLQQRVGIGTDEPGEKLHVSGGKIKLIGAAGGGAAGGILSGEVTGELHIQSEDYTGSTFADIVFDAGNGSGSYQERARIDSSGNLSIATGNLIIGTAGKGIDFSATANSSGTMTNELLSDYEEGTWEPRIADDGAAFVGTTYTTRNGVYRKIGSLVFVSYDIDVLLAGTLTGNASIGNLPFPVVNSGDLRNGGGSIGHITGLQQNYVYQSNFPQNNSTYLFIIGRTAASNQTSLVSSSNFFANSMRITGQAWYSV